MMSLFRPLTSGAAVVLKKTPVASRNGTVITDWWFSS
jgi:hypothetical protein